MRLQINLAGEHVSGWEFLDADDDNLIVWWALDLAGGRIPAPDKNAQLHDRVKHYIYRLNKFGGCVAVQVTGHIWHQRWSWNLLGEIFPRDRSSGVLLLSTCVGSFLPRKRCASQHDTQG